MKLKKGIDFGNFFRQVRCCQGQVWFRTDEGDCLNLKSQLSQYLFIATSMDSELPIEGEIICDLETDRQSLSSFVMP